VVDNDITHTIIVIVELKDAKQNEWPLHDVLEEILKVEELVMKEFIISVYH